MLRVLDSIRWSEGFVSLRIIVCLFVCLKMRGMKGVEMWEYIKLGGKQETK